MSDLHVEPRGALGHRLADAPGADDGERGAVDVGADPALRLPRAPLAVARVLAASTMRRATASMSAQARSAVASVSTSGVLPTWTSRAAAASRSMLSKPIA